MRAHNATQTRKKQTPPASSRNPIAGSRLKASLNAKNAAARRVDAAKAAIDVAEIFVSPTTPILPPYLILDAKAQEFGNLRTLVEMALGNFKRD